MFLYDCDQFTREYYLQRYGVEQAGNMLEAGTHVCVYMCAKKTCICVCMYVYSIRHLQRYGVEQAGNMLEAGTYVCVYMYVYIYMRMCMYVCIFNTSPATLGPRT
jgi:hypothetical protein